MARHAQLTQYNKFAISVQYLKKELSDEVESLHADKYESLLQIDRIILMGMDKHPQSSQNSEFAMSLQYLKKEVKDEVDFWHADKHQSFYKLILSFLVEVSRHVQNSQNRKLVMSLQYVKKKLVQLLCVLLWCKTFRYFTRSNHVRCYLCLYVVRRSKSIEWHFELCNWGPVRLLWTSCYTSSQYSSGMKSWYRPKMALK